VKYFLELKIDYLGIFGLKEELLQVDKISREFRVKYDKLLEKIK